MMKKRKSIRKSKIDKGVIGFWKQESQDGFVALTSVLVVSALVLFVATSISLLGIGEAKSSHDYYKGNETLKIAEGCMEEALLRIRKDSSYSGTGSTITIGNGACTISISGTGADRTATIEAEISGQPLYRKRLEVNLKVTGNSVNIISYEEVE